MFEISSKPLDGQTLSESLASEKAGALVIFEGKVRNHNEGKQVQGLEYQVYHELALKEGQRILLEAQEKFDLHSIKCVHREGHLKLGEIAIWIGATSSHRDAAFRATRFVIDEIKHRLPIWKKEHYVDQGPEWVFCRHQHHHVNLSESSYYEKQSGLVNQNRLKRARVLVVGAGGLGCPTLMNLAAAGVGHISIVDPDHIQVNNIHRQMLYAPHLVGEKKAQIAKRRLEELNPFITIEALTSFIKFEHIQHDLVLDCTDNMETKYFLHDACHKLRIPLISASLYKNEGQLRTFVPGLGCLRCFSQTTPEDELLGNCNDFGVIGSTASVLGSLQASEAIEFLNTGTNSTQKHSLYLNLKDLSQIKIKNNQRIGCEVCEGKFPLLTNDLEVDGGMEILDIRHLTDEEVLSLKPNKVALCCHRGIRSKRLAKSLRHNGHEVYSLRGGACSL